MRASKFDNTEDRKILLAPEQAHYRPNEILFERSDGGQFGNNLMMNSLKASSSSPGRTAVAE